MIIDSTQWWIGCSNSYYWSELKYYNKRFMSVDLIWRFGKLLWEKPGLVCVSAVGLDILCHTLLSSLGLSYLSIVYGWFSSLCQYSVTFVLILGLRFAVSAIERGLLPDWSDKNNCFFSRRYIYQQDLIFVFVACKFSSNVFFFMFSIWYKTNIMRPISMSSSVNKFLIQGRKYPRSKVSLVLVDI